jgi:hypothetical protein
VVVLLNTNLEFFSIQKNLVYNIISDEEYINFNDTEEGTGFQDMQFTKDFKKNLWGWNYEATFPYWQDLSLMYDLINPDEIKEFISKNNNNLHSLLLKIPSFVQEEFPNDRISLKLDQDPDNGEDILKAYIETDYSPFNAVRKLDVIDDLIWDIETPELIEKFLLDVKFL